MKKPVFKVRSRSIVLSVWENNNDQLDIWETIQLERIYKDKQGQWTSTTILRPQDLDDVKDVIQAYKQEKNIVINIPYEKKE